MAGISIRTDLSALDQLRGRLARLAARVEDKTPLMDEIGSSLVASTVARFETGRGPGGIPWPVSGRARATGGLTLVDRGHLKQSITHSPGNDQVEIGTNLIYGGIHQQGGRIEAKGGGWLTFRGSAGWARVKAVDIPARPFLGIDQSDEIAIGRIIDDYLAEPLR